MSARPKFFDPRLVRHSVRLAALGMGVWALRSIGADDNAIAAAAGAICGLVGERIGSAADANEADRRWWAGLLTNEHVATGMATAIERVIEREAADASLPMRHLAKQLAPIAHERWVALSKAGAPFIAELQDSNVLTPLAEEMAGDAPPALEPAAWTAFLLSLVEPEHRRTDPPVVALAGHLARALHTGVIAAFLNVVAEDLGAKGPLYAKVTLRYLARIDHATQVIARGMPDPPGFDLDAYADAILRFLAPLPLSQIVNQPDLPNVSVAEVFVPLMVREIPGLDLGRIAHAKELADWDGREHLHEGAENLRRRRQQMEEFLRAHPVCSAADLIHESEGRNFILLGEAGGGKTLLSRHLAINWASAWRDPARRGGAGRVPIYIELKDYARALGQHPTLTLFSYCHSGCNRLGALNESDLRQALRRGAAFLVADGLDEVLDPGLKEKITRELIGTWQDFGNCVLTSRIADFAPELWRRSERWRAYRIEPLDAEQQALFIDSYHRVFFLDDADRAHRLDRMRTKLRDFHRLAELAGTPLLLTLLCLVNREPALPETRTALYEAAARLLLHQWDFFHFGEDGPLQSARLAPLELAEKHLILRRLAWLLMMGRPAEGKRIPEIAPDSAHLSANIFPESVVEEAVRGVLAELGKQNVPSYVRLVPKLLAERNSVLCAAGQGKHSFVHRTFLEFYAAWAWHEEDAPWLGSRSPAAMAPQDVLETLFERHWNLPSWRLILVLYFGRVQPVHARVLLGGLLDLAARQEGANAKSALLQIVRECISEAPQRGKLKDIAEDVDAELLRGDRFDHVEVVNRGSESVVYRAQYRNPPTRDVAIKVRHSDPLASHLGEALRREALALVSSRHTGVIRLDDFHRNGELHYLVTEYAPLGDLRRYIAGAGGRLGAEQAAIFLGQALEALSFVHRAGILHGDITLENILVASESQIWLADFGWAVLPGERNPLASLHRRNVSWAYVAPEVLEHSTYDQSSDVYSLGVCAYEALTGVQMFGQTTMDDALSARRDENIEPLVQLAPHLPRRLSEVISAMVRYSSAERPSARAALEMLRSKG